MLETRTGKRGSIGTVDSSGDLNLQSQSGVIKTFSVAGLANSGNATFINAGRLRSQASSAAVGGVGGGVWFDGTTAQQSYVGRGGNSEAWTGIYANNGWRFTIADNGAARFNTTVGAFNDDLVIGPNQGSDADADLVLVSRSGKRITLKIFDTFGTFGIFGEPSGGAPRIQAGLATLSNGGVWTNASSRTLKTGFVPINPLDMLSKVMSLPLSTWTYKGSTEGTHLGPMAEDFKAIFGLAGDGKSIGTVDADGVALAAIQGLNLKLSQAEQENRLLREELSAAKAAFEVRLQALEGKRAEK